MWNILNYSNLASLTHLSAPTVKKFIETLEETFIVFRQRPFFRNKLKEINKSPKLYFIDPGFRNWFISRYEFSPEEKGILFENFILTELIKKWKKAEDLKFRRTNDEKYEVDLVLETEQKACEIKFKFETKKKDFKWLEKFLQLYPSFTTDIITRKNFLSFIK
jgi:predicted AAA+ superfamily ATPase